MCFGHNESDPCDADFSSRPAQPDLSAGGNSVFGRIDTFPLQVSAFGSSRVILREWSSNRVDCTIHHVARGMTLPLSAKSGREKILVVEAGIGRVLGHGSGQEVEQLSALRAGPSAEGSVEALSDLRLLEVSMASQSTPAQGRSAVEIVHPDDCAWKLYEYEALGQEVFTPAYAGGLGLLRFIFPQDEIPVHVHPRSGRIIRPISGAGYTYIHPDRCPMSVETIAAFDANVIHTNGPLAGQNYQLWALQLPWIESGIDTQNIAGHENFVRYVRDVPTPERYKSQNYLLDRIKSQAQGEIGLPADH